MTAAAACLGWTTGTAFFQGAAPFLLGCSRGLGSFFLYLIDTFFFAITSFRCMGSLVWITTEMEASLLSRLGTRALNPRAVISKCNKTLVSR